MRLAALVLEDGTVIEGQAFGLEDERYVANNFFRGDGQERIELAKFAEPF